MGGNSSTRRVVVEDTGGEEHITISEAVARRLKGQSDQNNSSQVTESPPVVSPPPQPKIFEPEPKTQLLKDKTLEDYYVVKLQELQEKNAALQKITNEQFANAVKEVEHKFLNITASPVCQDLQAKVLDCYQSHPGEILNCSALVSAFTTCVDRARMSISATRVQMVK
uniref:CHCH domain-containing protein n=1 Tax=Arion vulgaris TaxID=1028688 RepID=A0A0B6ZHG3_9EUPU